MSLVLWQKIPAGFLKRQYRSFDRLDHEVKLLVVELAKSQDFKCAFCSSDRDLYIEHDHDPEQGDGDRPTIHNMVKVSNDRGVANYLRGEGDVLDFIQETPLPSLHVLPSGDMSLSEIGSLAGEKIRSVLTRAPGNGAPLGGVKVMAASGWFAARPSGTEDIYKIYAESFRGPDHLRRILEEAQTIVSAALEAPPRRQEISSKT